MVWLGVPARRVQVEALLDPGGTVMATATGSKTGFRLTPHDCGAMAVIRVTAGGAVHTFIVPQDSNVNGIPDVVEAVVCPPSSPCPTGREDTDVGPVIDSPVGDGIAAFDDLRISAPSTGYVLRATAALLATGDSGDGR